MALETFRVNTTTDDVVFSMTIGTVSDPLHPYMEHIGALALFNKKGSGKILRLKNVNIDIINKAGVNTAIPPYINLQKISAYTGGSVVSPINLDSTNSALPSEVVCVQKPSTVTTSGQILRKMCNHEQFNTASSDNSMLTSRSGRHNTIGSAKVFGWLDASTAQTQKIVLREGEGIGLVNSTSAFWATAFRTEIIVRETMTGDCYMYSDESKWNDLSPLVLLNGTGSGVVLEVVSVHTTETGAENSTTAGTSVPSRFLLTGIELADISRGAGSELTPYSMDSTNSIGSDIVCYKNCLIRWDQGGSGALYIRPEKWLFLNQFSQNDANISSLPIQVLQRYKSGITSRTRYTDLVLREGKGIAIQQFYPSKYVNHELSFTFTVQDVFPTEAQVEDGVTYGSEGDDKTGTLASGGGDDVFFGVFSS